MQTHGEKCLVQRDSEWEVTSEIQAKFDLLIAKGEIGAQVDGSGTSSSQSLYSDLQHRSDITGGDVGQFAKGGWATWSPTIDTNPIKIKIGTDEIHTAISDADRKTNLKRAVSEYLKVCDLYAPV